MDFRAAKPWIGRLLRALVGLAVGLLLVEATLWFYPLDWSFLRGGVPRMEKELQVHQAVSDPRFLVRLRPGSQGRFIHDYGPFSVRVNALGFRGAERTVARTPNTFRIICVGGSNVYGAGLNDNQTWPARLEQRLNAGGGRRHEVWNLGVSGYNNLQLSAMADEALARYAPDLLLVAMSNWGPRHFLGTTPDLAGSYRADPTLWLEVFPAAYLAWPPWPGAGAKQWLLSHLGLYRLALAARLAANPEDRLTIPRTLAPRYAAITRRMLQRASKKTRVAVFICPAVKPLTRFEPSYRGLGVPVMTLGAAGRPQEFSTFHPPPHVMDWYAEQLAAWLRTQKLLGD